MPVGKRKHADAYHADGNPEQAHHGPNQRYGGSTLNERRPVGNRHPGQDAEKVGPIHPPGVTFADPPGGTERELVAPQRYSGNPSDSRATMNDAMPDPRPARNQGFAVKHPRWEPHVRIYIIALVPVTIWNIIPT
jgi:hypothetical protein